MDNLRKCIHCDSKKEDKYFHFNTSRNKYENTCEECWQKRRKEYCATNLVNNNIVKKRWSNENKIKVTNSRKKWKEENIGKVKSDKANRKKHLILATPKWLNKLQIEAMELSYQMADLRTQCFGIEYQVDHIIPLRGKNVCGLNVPWNLEVITKEENLKKGNKLLSWRLKN